VVAGYTWWRRILKYLGAPGYSDTDLEAFHLSAFPAAPVPPRHTAVTVAVLFGAAVTEVARRHHGGPPDGAFVARTAVSRDLRPKPRRREQVAAGPEEVLEVYSSFRPDTNACFAVERMGQVELITPPDTPTTLRPPGQPGFNFWSASTLATSVKEFPGETEKSHGEMEMVLEDEEVVMEVDEVVVEADDMTVEVPEKSLGKIEVVEMEVEAEVVLQVDKVVEPLSAAAGQPGPLPAAASQQASIMLEHSYCSSRTLGKPLGNLSRASYYRYRALLLDILTSYSRQNRMELVLCLAGGFSQPSLPSPLCPGKLRLAISSRNLADYLGSRSVWCTIVFVFVFVFAGGQ
jgi:hypothetical protein